MPVALFVVGGAIAAIFLLQTFARTDAAVLARVLKTVFMVVAVVVGVLMLIRGLAWLGIGFFALPLLFALPFGRRDGSKRASGAGGRRTHADQRDTPSLSAFLDASGAVVDGVVRKGQFAGRSLSSLSMGELLGVLDAARLDDPEAAELIEAYLTQRQDAGGADGPMSRAQAYDILGLRPGAGEGEIRAAHHRLIASLHPDQGGSSVLAALVNQARDVLLKS